LPLILTSSHLKRPGVGPAAPGGGGGGEPGDPLFFDDFNYVVDRTEAIASKSAKFQAAGWNGIKDVMTGGSPRGYIYTVDAIPGYGGSMPGSSSRVLCLEAQAETLGGQTDFYLSYGDVFASPRTTVPGDVWFQFWLYPNYSGSQLSEFGNHQKFLYMANYSPVGSDHMFMGSLANYTAGLYDSVAPGVAGDCYPVIADAISDWASIIKSDYAGEDGNFNHLGIGNTDGSVRSDVDPNTGYIARNRWTLVKMHFNTNNADVGNAFECWLRAYGRADFTKVAEFISGTTPDFSYPISSGFDAGGRAVGPGGHRGFRMPTTGFTDFWLYMADFAMASSESDLPTYED
jgi:hypothetical protein